MVVAAFNQEKALVGAFSVITNLRMELFEAPLDTAPVLHCRSETCHGHSPYSALSPFTILPRRNCCQKVAGTTSLPPMRRPLLRGDGLMSQLFLLIGI